MTTLPQEVVSSVAVANLKSVAETPAMLSNLAYSNDVSNNNLSQQNSVSDQQATNQLGASILASVINSLAKPGPKEGEPGPATKNQGGAR